MQGKKTADSDLFPNRLNELIKLSYSGRWTHLARAAGISPGSFGRYVNGAGKPTFDQIALICAASGVNANWLLTGEGPMMKGEGGETPEGIITVPHLDVDVSAGDGTLVVTEDAKGGFPFQEAYFRKMIGHDPRLVVMVNVVGDSMYPTLAPNDVVAVLVTQNQEIVDGLWVVRVNTSTLIKRIQVLPGQLINVKSDNPAYDAFQLNMGEDQPDFSLVGRVVWAPREF